MTPHRTAASTGRLAAWEQISLGTWLLLAGIAALGVALCMMAFSDALLLRTAIRVSAWWGDFVEVSARY